MKRCPQCQFVYEEEQAFCDMDGARLIHDTHALPPTGDSSLPKRSAWKTPVFIGLPLVVVAMLAIFALRSTSIPATPVDATPSTNAAPATDASPVPQDSPADNQQINADASAATTSEANEDNSNRPDNRASNVRRSGSSSNSSARTPRNSAANNSAPPPAKTTTHREEKDQSRIGSIFSKTKRIIKKPFKF
jgi:hypothetical protein